MTIPEGVTEQQWSNPIWQAVWKKRNPDWNKTGTMTHEKGTGTGGAAALEGKFTTGPITQPKTQGQGTGQGTEQAETQKMPWEEWGKWKGAHSYFDPKKSTVQGQLEGLLSDPTNPIAMQAKNQVNQAYNARGMMGSERRIGETMSNMVSALTPIAQADAEIYQALDLANLDYDFKKNFLNQSQKFDWLMENAKLSSQEQQQLGTVWGAYKSNMLDNINRILNNPDLDAGALEGALSELFAESESFTDIIADLFGYEFQWE